MIQLEKLQAVNPYGKRIRLGKLATTATWNLPYVEGGITVDAVVACSVKNVEVKDLNWHSMFRHLVLWKTTKMKD